MLASQAPDILSPPLCVTFEGGPTGHSTAGVRIAAPWLAGPDNEEMFGDARPIGTRQGVHLFRNGDLILGYAREDFRPAELAAQTEALYRRVLAASQGRHLVRIWNYLPRINDHHAGLEHYRAFCKGRSFAFESALGQGFQPQLPAASAVGSQGQLIDILFAATTAAPRHYENPEQVPAYHYPAEHGPRAPSFARATVVQDGRRRWTFVSGTSAIKGHQTVGAGAIEPQIDCTLDNLAHISRAIGLGPDLGAGRVSRRTFKIYLRHTADLALARARLEASLLRPTDRVTYLQADICRAALNIEIEATLLDV